MGGRLQSNVVSDVMSFNLRLSGNFLGIFFIGSGQAQRFASDSRRLAEAQRLAELSPATQA